jgi:ATP-dependent DNA helicase RecG
VRKDVALLIEKVAGGVRAKDFAFLAPTGAIDRRNKVTIAETNDGEIATLEVEVDMHLPSVSAKMPYRIRLRDETGFLTVTYFRPKRDMLERLWPVGQTRLISGKVETWQGERQMLHPDHVVDPTTGQAPPDVEPVYPLTAGLPLRTLQRAVRAAVALAGDPPEWLGESTVAARQWPRFGEALRRLHTPEDPDDVAPAGPFRTRLAYDELFARQCALRLRRAGRRFKQGRAIDAPGARARAHLAALPSAIAPLWQQTNSAAGTAPAASERPRYGVDDAGCARCGGGGGIGPLSSRCLPGLGL